jgi:inhibitor of KinA
VCYGGDFWPDLETVASAHGLQVDDVIRPHRSVEYLAFLLVSRPASRISASCPQLHAAFGDATPRVPVGSVAIGGAHGHLPDRLAGRLAHHR